MLLKALCVLILSAVISYVLLHVLSTTKKHPNAGLTTQELIKHYGYPVEVYEVTTEDGYILTLERIPHGKKKTTQKKVPILLVPGILQSAWDFVHFGPNTSLSFLLAEKGYDVWLGNVRGTTPSRKHVVLNPDTDEHFWNFNVHEIGFYDIPAFIDHILDATGQDSLHYLGYSQGSIAFFIMGSEKQHYLQKIRLMTALAPTLFINNPRSPILRFLGEHWIIAEKILEVLNVWELARKDNLATSYCKFICNKNSIFLSVCKSHISMLFGYSEEEVDEDLWSLTSSNTPTGVSSKQMIHIFQVIQSGKFQKYDYGSDGNLQKYGQEIPPQYNLSKIINPVAVYYAPNDWTLNEENVDILIQNLPKVVKNYRVPSDTFNHLNFVNAKNVVKLVYNAVIDELSKY